MAATNLLVIHPQDLQFQFELKKQLSCAMELRNTSDKYVAFKIRTTSPKKYRVKPVVGVVLPGSTYEVEVILQPQSEAPPDMQCNDKFLVVSAIAPDGMAAKDVSQDMFNKDSGVILFETLLRVIYTTHAQNSSPTPEFEDKYLITGAIKQNIEENLQQSETVATNLKLAGGRKRKKMFSFFIVFFVGLVGVLIGYRMRS